jgi:tyrosine-protein phosphatase SIW14
MEVEIFDFDEQDQEQEQEGEQKQVPKQVPQQVHADVPFEEMATTTTTIHPRTNDSVTAEAMMAAPAPVPVHDADVADDEEVYDRYVPTDRDVVEAYLNRVEAAETETLNHRGGLGGANAKLEHATVGENGLLTFSKSVVGMYMPPENFARVCEGIYRSSFPRVDNFPFLESLHLKSILCLILESYPVENVTFNEQQGIKIFQIGLSGNKEPFVKIKPDLVTQALQILIDPANQPILVHCNRGKHRTGCVVGCIRKLQQWSHSMIFDEYRRYAYPKERPLDQQFIEMYDEREVEEYARQRNLLPIRW